MIRRTDYPKQFAAHLVRWCCAIWIAGCAIQPDAGSSEPQLNSERIKAKFGSYGVEVLSYAAGVRVANLFSQAADGGKTTRTLAVTRFNLPTPVPLVCAHTRIQQGASIGATFKAAGWSVSKQSQYVGPYHYRADQTRLAELMGIMGDRTLALHIYALILTKDNQSYEYALIAELHHPDYLNVSNLRAIVPAVTDIERSQAQALRTVLDNVLQSREPSQLKSEDI